MVTRGSLNLLLFIHCLSCCLLKRVRDGPGDRPARYSMGTNGSFPMGTTTGTRRYVTYISCEVKCRTVTLHTPSRCEQGWLYNYRHCLKARNDAGSRTIMESQKSRYTAKVGGGSYIYIYIYKTRYFSYFGAKHKECRNCAIAVQVPV